MRIMGFDIASYKTGWFILDVDKIKFKIGLIDVKGNLYERVRKIGYESKKLFKTYNPEIVLIEDTYLDQYRKHRRGTRKRGNINTLKTLEKCHGAVISNTNEYMDIYYINPSEHKKILTGIGNASKQSTIWQIQKKLNLINIDDNMADAAALVLSWLVKRKQWDILQAIKNKYEN